MNHPPPFQKTVIVLITMICIFFSKSYTQSIMIDSTFISSGCIFPFNQNDTIYGLGITGHVTLNSDTSLIRVIFVNSDFDQSLLYEAYPLICDEWDFDIVNESDETKYLSPSEPYSLIVQTCNASFNLTSLMITGTMAENPDSLQKLHKENIEQIKISNITSNIQEYEMLWLASETSVSSMSYSEKKKLFGDEFNTKGIEYYAGGIYDPLPATDYEIEESDLVPKFDWRTRHGANDPNKGDYYYDGQTDGSGWLTSIKDQRERNSPECDNLCYIYGPLGAAEGVANVYFNQHLDFDLSEQQVLDCDGYNGGTPECTTDCDCGNTDEAVPMLAVTSGGVVDQDCYPIPDPYIHPNNCIASPLNPGIRVRIPQGVEEVFNNNPPATMDDKKRALIEHGPLITSVDGYSQTLPHTMVLVGYGEVNAGDILFQDPFGGPDTVDRDSPYIGRTYWIFKNSWGTGYGDNGYMYQIETEDGLFEPEYCNYFVLPVIDELNNWEIKYWDRDNDGYYWWGIGEKPLACPGPGMCDSDDSEPRIGPYDNNFYGTPVKPIIEVSINNQAIDNGGFYVFTDLNQSTSISFDVKNLGDAQLNFKEVSAFPDPYAKVTLSGDDANSFSYGEDLSTEIAMNGESGDQDDFTLSYDGTCSGTCTCVVTIHLDEFDMEDFTFAIIYADCDHIPSNERITSNVTWDGWNVILDNYNIEDGGELTITGNIGFSDQVNLVIEQGGRLIIDGGSLTNVCGNTWKGIDVWGNSILSQYPSSNQGYLSIINGGKIQNADIAVQVADAPDINTYTVLTTGGIVICDNAKFLNNRYDVIIYPYQNINPGNGMDAPNFCSFKNSYFLTKNTDTDARWHVGLWGVDGIRFKGCTFENTTDFVNTPLNDKIDVGIYSHNSGFYVEEYCTSHTTPCTSEKPCNFTNLKYGIYAANSIYSEFISIDTAIFLNNLTGIYMSAVDEQRITTNIFSIDHFQDFTQAYDAPKPVGLYLEACKYYMVEENTFTNESTIENATGIHILNSGPYANEVYNNFFIGYKQGITAAGENRDGTGVGLCLKCNDFRDCETDIYITEEGGTVTANLGIQQQQGIANGLTDGPASNTFTDAKYFTVDKNIHNKTNTITYAHHDNNGAIILKPSPISGNIILDNDEFSVYSKTQSCPSNLNGSIDVPTEMMIISNETIQIEVYQDTLDTYVDGGNTENLTLEVQTSFPDEALQIRQELLNESPYLSDTVMESAIIKETVLPNVMIRDILVANPQSAKSTEVLNRLDDRFIPMPDYMMAEIMQGQYISGAKEMLEQRQAEHKTAYSKSLLKLIRYYKQDTIHNWAHDSLLSLLLDAMDPIFSYEAAFIHLGNGDSISSQDILNDIPIQFELSNRELNVHDHYLGYFDILYELNFDTINGLDSLQTIALTELAQFNTTKPGVLGRNHLLAYNQIIYNEPVYSPDIYKTTPEYQEKTNNGIDEQKILKVYPNPASDYFIIENDLLEKKGNHQIIISDLNGKYITSSNLNDSQNQKLVTCGNLNSGVYLIQLFNNSSLIEAHRLIISK